MNEAQFTTFFKKKLQEREFYVKKISDGSTRGLPDTFIAKEHKGMFVEIKFIDGLKKLPHEFTQFSCVAHGTRMIQLVTMVELNQAFLSRYIICYRIDNENLIGMVMPDRILTSIKSSRYPIPFSSLPVPINVFIPKLEAFLQL